VADAALALLADRLEASGERPWHRIRRPSQAPPAGDWRTWLILAGRGWGKTRTGAEWVLDRVEGGARRIALVARTAADIRDVMIEGESGILACASESQRPTYEPSKRRLTWPNGAIATAYSADQPSLLRGPQHDSAWADELAAWEHADETWAMLMFGLRLGADPRVCVTTTPRPTQEIRDLVGQATTALTRGSTMENADNLAPGFLEEIVRRYEGTRLGRQELYAEILDDTPGALWTRAMLEAAYVDAAPELVRVVVAIDPAATAHEESDETGIVVAGRGVDGHAYVLADRSCRMSPDGWARRAVAAFDEHQADRIVAEVNNGGDMVEAVVRTVRPGVPYRKVHATRGKRLRAEPVAALYEQGRVHHVGRLPELEDQLTSWTPEDAGSPDRLDALVWAITELGLARPVTARAVPGPRF
jgi:predicted phage terminase large subunit-like protein